MCANKLQELLNRHEAKCVWCGQQRENHKMRHQFAGPKPLSHSEISNLIKQLQKLQEEQEKHE